MSCNTRSHVPAVLYFYCLHTHCRPLLSLRSIGTSLVRCMVCVQPQYYALLAPPGPPLPLGSGGNFAAASALFRAAYFRLLLCCLWCRQALISSYFSVGVNASVPTSWLR